MEKSALYFVAAISRNNDNENEIALGPRKENQEFASVIN